MRHQGAPRLAPVLLTGILLLSTLGGCSALQKSSKTERGAAAGAVLGAVTGAVIAKQTDGNAVKGAIIGATAGGVVGAAAGHMMDRQAKELQEQMKEADVVAVKDSTGNTVGVHIVLSSAILFDVNRADLRPSVRQTLDTLAASLQRYPETVLVVAGHTDADGTDSYNQQLSERRAASVTAYLQDRGIAADRMRSVGMGESSPVAPNDTPTNKQKNRRVEIGIVPTETDA